mgnify:CR=1 FL=1
MSRYLIRRDDGISDGIAGQVFDSYDAAYAVLERYYADMCCSDDREYYRIEVLSEELPISPQLTPSPRATPLAAGRGPGRRAAQPAPLRAFQWGAGRG